QEAVGQLPRLYDLGLQGPPGENLGQSGQAQNRIPVMLNEPFASSIKFMHGVHPRLREPARLRSATLTREHMRNPGKSRFSGAASSTLYTSFAALRGQLWSPDCPTGDLRSNSVAHRLRVSRSLASSCGRPLVVAPMSSR